MWWHDISSHSKPCSVLVYSKNGCKGRHDRRCAVVTDELITFIRTLQAWCCSGYLVCAFLYRKRWQVVTTDTAIENVELTPVRYASVDLNYVQYMDGQVSCYSNNKRASSPILCWLHKYSCFYIYGISFYYSKAQSPFIMHVYVDRHSILCCKKSNTEDI